MITPPKHTLNQIAAAWEAQLRDAADKPWLFDLLMREWARLLRRFAHYYRRLVGLPRAHKRSLKRTLATTLAGAALLLAMGQPLPARAATITVDGVVCTLAEAIDSANNDSAAGNGCVDGNGADILDLQTDILLTATLPSIASEITLEGNGHTLDGNNAFQVLDVAASGDLILNDATVTGGAASFGGGIYNQGTVVVDGCTISGNSATIAGGGISNRYDGTVSVNNSTLSGNSTPNSGGGIFNQNTLTVNNSTISVNSANTGGGIQNSDGTLIVNNSILSSNHSTATGGGIANGGTGSILTVNNSTLTGNTAGKGGGIGGGGTMIVNTSLLYGNQVYGGFTSFGGGIYSSFGTLTVSNSTISGNSATIAGGGISSYHSSFVTVTVNNSTISGNSAGSGGGIHNRGISGSTFAVNNSTVSGNSATSGGGIHNNGNGTTLTINNSTVSGNSATSNGGGISNDGICYFVCTLNLNRSLISGNSASDGAEVHNAETINASNYNVVGYGGSARSSGFTPGPNDIIPSGPLTTVLDATLADHGGPTFTHALVSGSVAIDTAPDAACLAPPINGVDQRGFPRNVDGDGIPSGNECDSGSFEYEPVSSPTPTLLPTNTPRPTQTGHPKLTATPRSSPTPTRTPIHPTETPNPRTPTRTPTPTQTPGPFVVVNQGQSLAAESPARPANPFMNLVVVTILALGNLLFFRKGGT